MRVWLGAVRRKRVSSADVLLLRCLDFFRNYDLDRTDGRGPSPIIADLVAELEARGVEIPS